MFCYIFAINYKKKKMTNFLKKLSKVTAIIVATSFMVGCSGEDGKDGEGFSELTKYGSISMSLDGIRPDNLPFTDSQVFKFTSVADVDDYNSMYRSGDDLEFYVARFLSAPDDTYQETYVEFELNVTDAGLPTETVTLHDFDIQEYAVISDDYTYFLLNDYFRLYDPVTYGISNVSVTNYSFNDTTNRLRFDYSFVVNGSNNDSDNELTIAGTVDVNVLEDID